MENFSSGLGSIPARSVLDLTFDKKGYCVIGTWGAGVFRSRDSTVPIPDPLTQLSNMITSVEGMSLAAGTESSLVAKLGNAIKALGKGHDQVACQTLQAFLNEVSAQRGKHLTLEQADELTVAAIQARTTLGCN